MEVKMKTEKENEGDKNENVKNCKVSQYHATTVA